MTSEASEYRGGGSVKCWSAAIERFSSRSPAAHLRQPARFLVLGILVAAFLIERQEAVEFHHRSGGAQFEKPACDFGFDVDRGALELGRFHLACHRAQPNQFVELGLIGIEEAFGVARPARQVGRANGLVGFLRVLGLGFVAARRGRQVFSAVIRFDDAAHRRNRFFGDLHTVGTHIGDQADCLAADVDAFVEPLRHAHGVRRRKTELAACFLLQRRGGERRVGVPLDRLRFDRGDREEGGFERLLEGLGFRARTDVEPLQLLAVGANEPRLESLLARRRQRGDERPIFLADEFLDFELAVADEPQRHRLHPARRAGAGQFAPQHGRQSETDQVIERPARQIGVDQGLIDGARMRHRLGHRLLGDGVEHHPFDRLRFERLLFLEKLQDVPGNRLALAIGVGRQNELVGIFDGADDIVQPLLGLGIDLPKHAEIMIRIDRTALGRQVANMAE